MAGLCAAREASLTGSLPAAGGPPEASAKAQGALEEFSPISIPMAVVCVDSRNIEELFEELLNLSRNLSDEQQCHVRENMTEEDLVVFDILTRPAPALSTEERDEVKKVARHLLALIRELLVINWRQKASARSQVKIAIEDVLDTGLIGVAHPRAGVNRRMVPRPPF